MDAAQRKSIDTAMSLIRETGTCAVSEEEFAALYAENEHLRARLDAVERLLVCYRIGKQPSEKLHRDLERTRRALAEG